MPVTDVFAHMISAKASAPTVADIMTKKYVDGLPPGKTREGLGQRRCGVEQSYHVQLGNPMYAKLAEASVQAHKAATSDPVRNPCG